MRIYFSSTGKILDAKNTKRFLPIKSYRNSKLRVIFVYGVDFGRTHKSFIAGHFWESGQFWILCIAFSISSFVLYLLRHQTGFRTKGFLHGIFEIYIIFIGGGSVQIRRGLEKLFFAAMFVAAFFLISIYLADYSMHSVLNRQQKVDSFAKLAQHNVTFFLIPQLAEKKKSVTNMLRYGFYCIVQK